MQDTFVSRGYIIKTIGRYVIKFGKGLYFSAL